MPTARLNVLVADDNAINRRLMKAIIGRMGHDVIFAMDGREALEVSRQGCDIILMDMQMPVMDGVTSAREIRRREAAEGLPKVPIVALTATASDEVRKRCLDAGMDDYLTKPLELAKLEKILAGLVAGKPDAS